MGLGLIISQQLVKAMQGSIDMQSLPGEGTIWQFNLNLGHFPDHDVLATPLPLHGMQVLYVDSSELNSCLLSNQFASWGMVPTKIVDQDSAIPILNKAVQQENPCPLVVIRHHPPTLDGYTLCREIRQSAAATAAKILLLTATDEGADPNGIKLSPCSLH